MGRRVEVTVGVHACKPVYAYDLVPGLVVHPAVGVTDETDHRVSITHERSGLALVTGLEDTRLTEAKELVQKLDWCSVLPDDFMEDTRYVEVVSTLEAMSAKENNERSKNQETRIAKVFGGKRQPASGSRWGARRDVITPKLLIEAKTTIHDSYGVNVADLAFLREQAYKASRVPAYFVEIDGKEELIVVPFDDVSHRIDKYTYSNKADMVALTLTKEMSIDAAKNGTTLVFDTAKGKFAIVGYETFLGIMKKGLDV